jgi:translocation and assembly module TamB
MATADVTRSKKRSHAKAENPPTRKSRAFRYGCLLTVGVLVAGTYFAPYLVGTAPAAGWAITTLLKLDGSASVGSASLGWFSPVRIENLEIHDAEGSKVLAVAAIETEKSLASLMLDFGDLGGIQVQQPVLHLAAQATDTNLERVFANILNSTGRKRFAMQLKIDDGMVLVDDTAAARQFQLENLSALCGIGASDEPLTLVASGNVADERQPGTFKLDLQAKSAGDETSALANGKVHCQTTALPLGMIDPVLRRHVKAARTIGHISTRLDGAWGDMAEAGTSSLDGESTITDLSFSAAALGPDRVEIDRIQLPCRVVQKGDRIEIERLSVECELGQVAISGSAKMSDLSAANQLAALVHEDYEIKGQADLAQIARRLPATLRIRQGTEITAGQVDLAIVSQQTADGMTWTGSFAAQHLAAEADGRPLTWKNPFALEFAAHEAKDGIKVDRAKCESSFLQIEGAGSIDDFTLSGSFDLARLTSELEQFSDLGGTHLSGQGQAELSCKRPSADQFIVQGAFEARTFQCTFAGGQSWSENSVLARLELEGKLDGRALSRIERGELSVEAGDERLQARLQEPVSEPATKPWPVQASWRGQLTSWTPRLATCLGTSGLELAGTGALEANLAWSPGTVEISQAKADFAQFRAWGHGLFISEPAVSVTADGKWDLARTRIEVAQGKLVAGTSMAVISQAAAQSTSNGWIVDGGTAQLAADLAQWYRWQHDPRIAPAWQISGRVNGEARAKYEAGTTTGQLDATVGQLQLVDLSRGTAAAAAAWREPQLTLAASGGYRHADQQLQLEKLQVASEALRCDANGAISLASAGGDVDLKGTMQYDWQNLSPLWRPYLGQHVQIEGRQTRSFAVRGRLSGPIADSQSWRQVVGEAATGWSAIEVYGMRVGPGEIAAQLADGQLKTQPIDIQVSEGRFTFTPNVRLSPAPAELFVAPGPLLTDVHLSPEICARGLKFVAPILAESTVADGRFSITMDGGRIPLFDPGAGDASGRMAMRAQVKSGPVAQEFMVLIKELSSILRRGAIAQVDDQTRALVTVDSSQVEFRLVNGRVYHRGLKFTAGTMPVTTHGSVGLDESLAIVAEVPIKATLFGQDLSLGALEGRTIQIPIGGSLGKPKLDRGAFEQIAGSLLQNAASGALLDGINKRLERLLPGQQ